MSAKHAAPAWTDLALYLIARFTAATGYAPVDYVQTLRIEEARQWLESSDEPVDVISNHVGYEDPTHFRRLFKRKVGTTPARYRQRFRNFRNTTRSL